MTIFSYSALRDKKMHVRLKFSKFLRTYFNRPCRFVSLAIGDSFFAGGSQKLVCSAIADVLGTLVLIRMFEYACDNN